MEVCADMHPTTFQVNSAWYDSEMAEKRWEFLDSLHSLLDKLEPRGAGQERPQPCWAR